MTTLREAAQQALDFIRWSQFVPCQSEPFPQPPSTAPQVEAALKAALAEPVQEPVANDDEVICPACCHQFRAIPPNVQQLMLNAGFKPPFTAPPQRPAEPVQEPVAWIHTDSEKGRVKFLEWRENEPGYRGDWIKTPLYAAPPRRKPLTREQIHNLYLHMAGKSEGLIDAGGEADFPVLFARALEEMHGITS